jgi:hypothetical protein
VASVPVATSAIWPPPTCSPDFSASTRVRAGSPPGSNQFSDYRKAIGDRSKRSWENARRPPAGPGLAGHGGPAAVRPPVAERDHGWDPWSVEVAPWSLEVTQSCRRVTL